MITYHKDLSSKFQEFGLTIPVRDDRSQKICKELSNNKIVQLKNVKLLNQDDLCLAHDREYIQKMFGDNLENEIEKCFELKKYGARKINYQALRDHIIFQSSAVIQSMNFLNDEGFVYHLGGGMHHAHSNQGRGFCLINEIVIGARMMQKQAAYNQVWIIDLDAHKGDGTSQITQNDSSINTLSIHQQNAWPLDDIDKTAPWFIPSDIDIPIPINQEDSYNLKLSDGLELLDKYPKADFAIIVAGADPYVEDALESSGQLRLSKEQLLERDLLVYNFLKKRNIPQFYLMAGGYGEQSWQIYRQFLEHLIQKGEI